MESDTKILKLLLSNKEEKFTIKKISERLKINYRIAYERVIVLEKEGLIRVTRAGNSKICEFTGMFNNKAFEAEYERKRDLFKNKDLLVIHSMLAGLKFPFIVLLFGSYAKGTADRHSDIDLLIIGGEEKKVRSEIALMPDKVHLTQISYEDFITMAKSREFSVVGEAMKNNIILIGIEEYYRLLKNAGC